MKIVHLLYLYSVFCVLVNMKLYIYEPEEARKMHSAQIPYTIANFGHIPYGKTIVGKLITPKPTDLCEIDPVSFKQHLRDQTTSSDNTQDSNELFALGKRGNCKFTSKAFNAQQSGASLAIISQKNEFADKGIVMANDGFGYKVNIPSIFISKESGQILTQLLQKFQKLSLVIKFDTAKSDKAILNLWIDPSDRHSYILVRDFYTYYLKIKDYVVLNLYYKIQKQCQYNCDYRNCLLSKQYCFTPHKLDVNNTGVDYIRESLREYFIFQKNPEQWWKYMDLYDQNCSMLNKEKFDCVINTMKSLKINIEQIQANIEAEEKKLKNSTKNTIPQIWADDAVRGNILFFPDVSINNLNYVGELIASDIFEMLCNSLTDPPEQCSSYVQVITKLTPSKSILPTIILIILLMAIGFIIVICIYRRIIKSEMKKEMSSQVNQMVSQYIAFYDNKETTQN